MALKIVTSHLCNINELPNIKETTKTIWEEEGITDQDHELAQELGIEDPIIDDFDTMVEKQENKTDEFNKDLNDFAEEQERAYSDCPPAECEVLNTNETREEIEVRVVKKWFNKQQTKWALGSIDGQKNVYIPKSLAKRVSVGELVRMNLMYHPQNPCGCRRATTSRRNLYRKETPPRTTDR